MKHLHKSLVNESTDFFPLLGKLLLKSCLPGLKNSGNLLPRSRYLLQLCKRYLYTGCLIESFAMLNSNNSRPAHFSKTNNSLLNENSFVKWLLPSCLRNP